MRRRGGDLGGFAQSPRYSPPAPVHPRSRAGRVVLHYLAPIPARLHFSSAPTILHRVQTTRRRKARTSAASDHSSATRTASWWHSSQVTASDRTPSSRMLPRVMRGPGAGGHDGGFERELRGWRRPFVCPSGRHFEHHLTGSVTPSPPPRSSSVSRKELSVAIMCGRDGPPSWSLTEKEPPHPPPWPFGSSRATRRQP